MTIIPRRLALVLLALPLLLAAAPVHADATIPHAVFLISEDPHNYEAHATIPPFAESLAREHGYRVSVLLREGDMAAARFPRLEEALAEADVLVVFCRRLALHATQRAAIERHLETGKPLIGIRTANHAFSHREAQEGPAAENHQAWWGFVPEVLGCENRGYGPVDPGTAVSILEDAAGHPILEGIPKAWHSPGNVYRVAPLVDDTAEVLLEGRVDDAVEPIAWTRRTKHGGRVFYTSLGHPGDFEEPHLPKLLINALQWCLQETGTESSPVH